MTNLAWSTPLEFDRVIVTGGGSGIGRATALELARCGVTVYVLGRREGALQGTVEQAKGLSGRIVPISCDLKLPDQVDAAFAKIEADGGPAYGLVHAAAQPFIQVAENITLDDMQSTIASSLITGFNTLQRWAAPILEANKTQVKKPGSAVMISSAIAARGGPGVAHSSAGKAGLESFSRAAAKEWAARGIRINIVGPGAFPVEKSEEMWAHPEMAETVREVIAMGRVGQLPEIVAPIMYFLTLGAGFTTGQTLVADGGYGLVPWGIKPELLARGLNNKY